MRDLATCPIRAKQSNSLRAFGNVGEKIPFVDPSIRKSGCPLVGAENVDQLIMQLPDGDRVALPQNSVKTRLLPDQTQTVEIPLSVMTFGGRSKKQGHVPK